MSMLNEGLQHLEEHQILLGFSVFAQILAGLSLQSYQFPKFSYDYPNVSHTKKSVDVQEK